VFGTREDCYPSGYPVALEALAGLLELGSPPRLYRRWDGSA